MLKQHPKKIVGFDPSALFNLQFNFINHFIKSNIVFELLGIEHIEFYEHKFDVIFLLGVLYHRSDPYKSLKSIYKSLNKEGELIVDSFIIEGDDEVCLFPKDRYSLIPNIYFIPTIKCFKNWLYRAGFKKVEVLHTLKTTTTEQRKTKWSFDFSLENFLDKNNPNQTVEGYPAPIRAYLKAIK
jgi:tRNA (mo5U34)-methyltransferase